MWSGVDAGMTLHSVVQIVACGAEHSAAVTDVGALLTWGKGANGRLGHGDEQTRATPTVQYHAV